jgi:hypothetical protein
MILSLGSRYSMLLLSVTHDSSPARNNMRAYL